MADRNLRLRKVRWRVRWRPKRRLLKVQPYQGSRIAWHKLDPLHYAKDEQLTIFANVLELRLSTDVENCRLAPKRYQEPLVRWQHAGAMKSGDDQRSNSIRRCHQALITGRRKRISIHPRGQEKRVIRCLSLGNELGNPVGYGGKGLFTPKNPFPRAYS